MFALMFAACSILGIGEEKEDDSGRGGATNPIGDGDGDGYSASTGDCDDDDAGVNPEAEEQCDEADNDCDGEVDEDADVVHFTDADGDGFGDASTEARGCPVEGQVRDNDDCDDARAEANPDATETCNGLDDDCDGEADNGVEVETWYADRDGDGWGSAFETEQGCALGEGWVTKAGDCDDGDALRSPDGMEVCNGADDDCDGEIDEDSAADAEVWFADRDHDGYGDALDSTIACSTPIGFVGDDSDCDDSTAAVRPGAEEVCNEIDDDCDGEVDGEVAYGSFYRDADGDGYGDPGVSTLGCAAPSGYVVDGSDCDDADETVYPTASEVWYDGIDQDCDTASDYDADGDGHESDAYSGDDCDDDDVAISPGAAEAYYDGIDADCSGGSDYDQDEDGYDAEAYGGDDCDDTDGTVYPNAPEGDATLDNDCDGEKEAMPVAVASYDAATSTLTTCATLYLDGTGSYDPDGGSLAYEWELTSAPAASALTTADIDAATDAEPSFTPDETGSYTFTLTVEDSGGATSYADDLTVVITKRATNKAPVADPGDDESSSGTVTCSEVSYGTGYSCPACPDHIFELDGTASSDADGDSLSYEWSVYSGTGSFLTGTTDSTAKIAVGGVVPTSPGVTDSEVVEVRLKVTDCFGATSAAASVTLTAECTGS